MEGFGGGTRGVRGQLLGGGQGSSSVWRCMGLLAFCARGCSVVLLAALLDVFEDFLHLIQLVAQLGELHVDLAEFRSVCSWAVTAVSASAGTPRLWSLRPVSSG